MVFRVDFEEVIQYYEHHGRASEEDGERVELAVGDHVGRAVRVDVMEVIVKLLRRVLASIRLKRSNVSILISPKRTIAKTLEYILTTMLCCQVVVP